MKWIVLALVALAMYLTTAPLIFGDGTDPMPLCRKVDPQTHQCPAEQ